MNMDNNTIKANNSDYTALFVQESKTSAYYLGHDLTGIIPNNMPLILARYTQNKATKTTILVIYASFYHSGHSCYSIRYCEFEVYE